VSIRTLATLDVREWDGLDLLMLVAGWPCQCQPGRRQKSSLKLQIRNSNTTGLTPPPRTIPGADSGAEGEMAQGSRLRMATTRQAGGQEG